MRCGCFQWHILHTIAICFDVQQGSTQAKKLHEDAVKEMELRRIVPTNVEQVKNALREMEEPATLFGERPVSVAIAFHLLIIAMTSNLQDAAENSWPSNRRHHIGRHDYQTAGQPCLSAMQAA